MRGGRSHLGQQVRPQLARRRRYHPHVVGRGGGRAPAAPAPAAAAAKAAAETCSPRRRRRRPAAHLGTGLENINVHRVFLLFSPRALFHQSKGQY